MVYYSFVPSGGTWGACLHCHEDRMGSRRLGDILRSAHGAPAEQIEDAARTASGDGRRIGEAVVDMGICSQDMVSRALATQLGLPFLVTLDGRIDEDLLRQLPLELFRDGRCLPLAADEKGLEVAMSDPLDLEVLLDIEAMTGMVCRTAVTTPTEMERWREHYFGSESLFSETVDRLAREFGGNDMSEEDLTLQEIRSRTESEPIVKLASLIFDEAIRMGASDIHLEPHEQNAQVRFRIDGMLHQHMELKRGVYVPLTSRIKVLADLDISEKRAPQDGSIHYERSGSQYDFRVSTLPTHHGEKTVVRILKHDKSLLQIENLGMSGVLLERVSEIIDKPQGMFVVTGPTGSGKSSTLFACLNRIRGKPINVTTIENPIEYKLDGVNQTQINEKAGVTFASVLRSILRQDPDVILIGEIRDGETAQIAMQASQTGHLVFSTLHTNDAVSAVTRLRDLNVAGYMIASSLLGILAQRLVRVLCPHCKHPAEPSEELRSRWHVVLGDVPMPPVHAAPGCDYCRHRGYAGRTGLFELVEVNEAVREMIVENVSEVKVRQRIRASGTKSLIQQGLDRIREGVTTPEELLRVVLVEDVMQMNTSR
ncbi:MAG: type II secretion system protein GspE [Chitinivibrionales bacterium]|nr:type II secretion system protein GspE [Chitinivibrionales bacterium]